MSGPAVSVIMPWRDTDDEYRQASRLWLKHWYREHHPRWDIIEGDCTGEWNKPTAINNAVKQSDAKVLIITDTDVLPLPDVLSRAVLHAQTAPWVVPHGAVYRLRPEPTSKFLQSDPAKKVTLPGIGAHQLIRSAYQGMPGGGLLVMRRQSFWDIGGFDPVFRQWGGEDSAFGLCADSLLGPHLRYHHVKLLHLYHPPGPREVNPHFSENVKRKRLYEEAASNPQWMAALRNVEVPKRTKLQLAEPKTTDPVEDWIHYLNWLGVRLSKSSPYNKTTLCKLAVQNRHLRNRPYQ